MKKLLFALVLIWSTPALAQNPTCPTRPSTDNSNACSSTAFVQTAISAQTTHFAAGGTSTGSANAQVVATTSPPVFSLSGNPSVTFTAGFSNTGATTMNVVSTGVVNVLKKTQSGLVSLVAGDIIAGQQYLITYDGTQYQIQTPTPPNNIIYYTCNGSSDSAPLATALAAAQAVGPAGGTLHISGNCANSSALTPTSNVAIEGDGMNSTFLSMASSATTCINFNPSGANKTLNLRNFTCTYPSLSSSGVVGIQFGNSSFNNISGKISWVDCTNCTSGINLLNAQNSVVSHSTISPSYNYGIQSSNPLAPDSGGNIIHDNYIQTFAPATTNTIGVEWISGGAFNLHDNQIFAPRPVYLHMGGQTSELNIHNNLIVGTGTPTAGIQVDAVSASFTCTQSGTNMTTTGVTGTIVTGAAGALGQTVTGTGVAAGTTIVSQTSGTPGGAGVYVTTLSGTASSAACLSTFIMTELIIEGNILDNTARPLLVSSNTGGEFLYNLMFGHNTLSSDNNSATNQITIFNTSGFTLSGNLIKCNGTCTSGRPIFTDASASKGLIIQGASSEIGSWGVADTISSSTTTNVAVFGGQTKTCGATIIVTNGVVTSC